MSELSFFYALNTDNRINYGPALENIIYLFAKSMKYKASVGRIGKLECDFILRSPDMDYHYVQVAYTILANKETEDREYRSLEAIKDNSPKYVMTMDSLIQKRNGIVHVKYRGFHETSDKIKKSALTVNNAQREINQTAQSQGTITGRGRRIATQ